MSGWFAAQIVHTGRLPLFCFFCAFLVSFCFIRLSVRLIRAQVRWWPGNISRGDTHVHHMVFGVIFMVIAGVAAIAPPAHSADWRAGAAALFGIGTALVLDEFALILHLRDVYWSSAGRVSIDAVLIAAGITALLLLGASPAGVSDVADYRRLPGGTGALVSLVLSLVLLFGFAAITLLKGKIWTGLLGLFLPFLFVVAALRLARPHSPWARWRYQGKPRKLARAVRRETRIRQPVIRAKTRIEDLIAGYHDRPPGPRGSARQKSGRPLSGAAVIRCRRYPVPTASCADGILRRRHPPPTAGDLTAGAESRKGWDHDRCRLGSGPARPGPRRCAPAAG